MFIILLITVLIANDVLCKSGRKLLIIFVSVSLWNIKLSNYQIELNRV